MPPLTAVDTHCPIREFRRHMVGLIASDGRQRTHEPELLLTRRPWRAKREHWGVQSIDERQFRTTGLASAMRLFGFDLASMEFRPPTGCIMMDTEHAVGLTRSLIENEEPVVPGQTRNFQVRVKGRWKEQRWSPSPVVHSPSIFFLYYLKATTFRNAPSPLPCAEA
jgi:hypothetical protein